jgi:hypothetical protein
MFTLWLIGIITILLGRAFYAGLRSKDLFYREPKRYGESGRQLDDDSIASYILFTVVISITWPVSLPVLGIYMPGKRFSKEK